MVKTLLDSTKVVQLPSSTSLSQVTCDWSDLSTSDLSHELCISKWVMVISDRSKPENPRCFVFPPGYVNIGLRRSDGTVRTVTRAMSASQLTRRKSDAKAVPRRVWGCPGWYFAKGLNGSVTRLQPQYTAHFSADLQPRLHLVINHLSQKMRGIQSFVFSGFSRLVKDSKPTWKAKFTTNSRDSCEMKHAKSHAGHLKNL